MPRTNVVLPEVPPAVAEGLRRLRERLDVTPEFPQEVLAEADQLLRQPPAFPEHTDRTGIQFVTVDPASSKDLDQAVHIARRGAGYVVHYAIADVAAWVRPGSALDREARVRGETLYAPGARVPLHPASLSEDAGSLLADGRARPAVLWTHELDSEGQSTRVTVERALVRSYAKLSYEGVQADLEADRAHPSVALLPEVGRRRQRLETERGGVSLNLPDQEIVPADGTWTTRFRDWLPVEDYNAQLSLMTGMAAAELMIASGIGVIRTLPPAPDQAFQRLRLSVKTLGVPWPDTVSYPDFVRGLEPGDPRHLAVLVRCARLFRGAGYVAFNDGVPAGDMTHAALAAPYTHATAPLRRLVDRYSLEICVRLQAGQPMPPWVVEGLRNLPEIMTTSNRRAKAWERGVIDLAEALVLDSRVGEIFEAVLIDVNPKNQVGTFQIGVPAVEAHLPADGRTPGQSVRVRLDSVDLSQGQVTFSHPG